MNYQSQAYQDRFVANILNFKRNGFYLDIGSCYAESCNNTYCFEELGWKGICIEKDSACNESYNKRTCEYINADALLIDYEKILANAPKTIDYLSLDIDDLSTGVLEILPLNIYSFNVITIEHDFYLNGDKYKTRQREILKDNYILLCSDVLVPLSHDTKPDWAFEDWWVHRSLQFSVKLFSERLYPKGIIEKFK